ncbi:hypothetical protein PGTUg99_000094 [Puccinia graminis f. sp. tritici]|uniref:Uncharacterized protein n=1 Tax=Puccinia graminis f. sp. tritici TaxID=56615 RepID=A0A5B0S2D4_PUCGR|nr:hypothetical protein PGTUg99_000094 [Puccinia graminis f. sp. tritici]
MIFKKAHWTAGWGDTGLVLAVGLVCVLVPNVYGCLVSSASCLAKTLGSNHVALEPIRFDIGVGLAGMRGPYEVNQWPWPSSWCLWVHCYQMKCYRCFPSHFRTCHLC